ncbi:MAG: DUF6580 family putative transport protein [Nitrospiria bacterium]
MLNVRFLTLVGIVLAAAAMRLIPHPPNFAPIMAMALFGGAYFASKKAAFAVPLAAMCLSDLFLGFDGSMPFIYGSFGLTVCLGMMIQDRRSPLRIGSAALAGSVLFFIFTNFGGWLTGHLYPKTAEGLIASYVAAIPFFRNTLLGDAVYTILLFGGFALALRYSSALRKGPAPVLGGNV